MTPEKMFVYLAGAVLATEVIKHREDSPHIHQEEQSTQNPSLGPSAYNISNMQTPTGPTMSYFITLASK